MKMHRRHLLKALGAGAASAVCPSILTAASSWASLPAAFSDLPKYKILEIHLPGGASQWETLWVSHDGAATSTDGWLSTGPA
ncbi:MAG: hypothetical protein KDK91_19105, partial [Gammaproteobacteria bacterium]|nr:hypothetical protein [Gammaproteobacteria bacterium]